MSSASSELGYRARSIAGHPPGTITTHGCQEATSFHVLPQFLKRLVKIRRNGNQALQAARCRRSRDRRPRCSVTILMGVLQLELRYQVSFYQILPTQWPLGNPIADVLDQILQTKNHEFHELTEGTRTFRRFLVRVKPRRGGRACLGCPTVDAIRGGKCASRSACEDGSRVRVEKG
jgi:hypothetical protein